MKESPLVVGKRGTNKFIRNPVQKSKSDGMILD